MNDNYGPFDLPCSEIPRDSKEFSTTDFRHPLSCDDYGNHYDSDLFRRYGGYCIELDRIYIGRDGEILDL